jgi:hypothetical protein
VNKKRNENKPINKIIMFDKFDDLLNKLSYSITNFERLDLKFEYIAETINGINQEVT